MPPSGKRNTNTILKDAVPPVNSLSFFFFLMLCKTFVDLTEQHEQKKKKEQHEHFSLLSLKYCLELLSHKDAFGSSRGVTAS